LGSLLNFKLPKIFLHDVRHGHAQCSGEVLPGHHLLPDRILQKLRQAFGKPLGIPRWIELNGQFFGGCHLPEVTYVGADNWNSVCTRQVRYAAAACG
jgi:hypothetical protein